MRAFLDEHIAPDLAAKVRGDGELGKDDLEHWHAVLNARGWLASNWSKEFGGAE